MTCPCGSERDFVHCCALIHTGQQKASTAELLMRARYSAFVVANIDFLYNSFHPSTRRFQSKQDIESWATANSWVSLEIVKSTVQTVEFRAHYKDEDGVVRVHHEKSNFKELQGNWYYVEGRLID